jgi:hypothetical protein
VLLEKTVLGCTGSVQERVVLGPGWIGVWVPPGHAIEYGAFEEFTSINHRKILRFFNRNDDQLDKQAKRA